jgi:pyridoxamine 5'-phosphate oxidase
MNPSESTPREHARLEVSDLGPDPIAAFQAWYDRARQLGLEEPGAMTLATATPEGVPSARMVLLRALDTQGFVFYTNHQSRKARELNSNPRAALVFYWAALDRQVRIEGTVEPVTAHESDAYFANRPRGSQISAWASPQSEVVPDRATLDVRRQEYEQRFAGAEVSRPPYWGGYRLRPLQIEFWQGRPNRFHDRLRYRLDDSGGWVIERLAP